MQIAKFTISSELSPTPSGHMMNRAAAGQCDRPAASGNVYLPDTVLRESEFDVVLRWLCQPD
jgi:hypothetical protein